MIRFLSDWDRYPSAIPDYQTRNKSFLRLAALYREMGVKHFYFHLALLQPELQGVDIHDEANLTLEQKARVLWEADHNPWFYIRECVVVKNTGTTIDEMLYKANRSNIPAMWLLLNSIPYVQIQPRQTGKSFGSDVNSSWLLDHHYKDANMVIITKDDKLRSDNIKRLKEIREEKPSYLQRQTNKDDNNQQSMSCKKRGNNLKILVSQASKKAANNMGRGMTCYYLQIDEGPFIQHIATTVSSAGGSMSTAMENAEKMGYVSNIIYTTTAGDPNDENGSFIYKIQQDAAPWDEVFYDCADKDSLKQLIKMNGHNMSNVVSLVHDALQLGKTKQWLRDAILRAQSDGANIDRDYFNQWKSSRDEAVLQGETAARVRDSIRDPLNKVFVDNSYLLREYEEIDSNTKYIVSIDTSEAAGNDGIGLVIINSRTGAVAAAAFIEMIDLIKFSLSIVKLLVDNPNFILNIEKAFNATVMIQIFINELISKGINPFTRIFNRVVQGEVKLLGNTTISQICNAKGKELEDYASLYKASFGFVTGNTTRTILYSDIFWNCVHNLGDTIYDNTLAYQMLNLVIRNSRIDHPTGGHDDMVVAYLIGHYTLRYGINLNFYGLKTSEILVAATNVNEESLTPVEQYELKVKRDKQTLVSELIDKLEQETDYIEQCRLNNRIETLLAEIGDEDTATSSMSKVNDIMSNSSAPKVNAKPGDGLGYSKLLN